MSQPYCKPDTSHPPQRLFQAIAKRGSFARTCALLIVWSACFSGLLQYGALVQSGWDFKVYQSTMHFEEGAAVRTPADPYIAGITRTQAFLKLPLASRSRTPLEYIYPPLTLIFLQWVGHISFIDGKLLYLVLYIGSVTIVVYAPSRLAEANELTVLVFFLPLTVLFPGLLQNQTVYGGNIAYVCYALATIALSLALRLSNWRPFYLTIFAISLCKPIWLILLLFPPILAVAELPAAFLCLLAGVGTLIGEYFFWPQLYNHFLTALEMEFGRKGYGVSPIGLLAQGVGSEGLLLKSLLTICYCSYACNIGIVLIRISSLYKRRLSSLQQVIPVITIGIFLLIPRLKDYDVATLTIPMILVWWRFCAERKRRRVAAGGILSALCLMNLYAMTRGGGEAHLWNLCEGVVVASSFLVGSWQLLERRREWHLLSQPVSLVQIAPDKGVIVKLSIS